MINRQVLAAALGEVDEYLADSTGVLVSKDSPILAAAREHLALLDETDGTDVDWTVEPDGSISGQLPNGGTWRMS